MDILPVEIAEEILTKCSKNVLTCVARTSKAFCTLSEMILYDDIRLDTAVCTHTEALRGCLRTLSGQTRKATYVRTFDLYIFRALQEPELNHLSAALFSMSNLKHLSLDVENFHAPSLATVLASALRRSTFSLHALRIPSVIECDSWIASQQHLEALAIYDHSGAHWEPEARDSVIRMQTWARQSRSPSKNIFLVKYRHGWPSDLIALSQSWNAKYLASLFAFPQFISVLYIFVDSPSMNIYIGTEASRSFPAVETLVLAAEDDRLQQISNLNVIPMIFAPFPKLKLLRIGSWNGPCRDIMNTHNRTGLARSWFSKSKSLRSVIFPDMSIIHRSE